MKYQLLLSGLLVSLAGCQQKTPSPASPLLGQWQADTERLVSYQANGQILRDTTVAHRREFDFTAGTCAQVDYQAASMKAPLPARSTWDYSLQGEAIGFSSPSGGNYSPNLMLLFVRSLTPTSFTLETQPYNFTTGKPGPGTSFITFHR